MESLWRRVRASQPVVLLLTATWFFVIIQYLIPLVLAVPLTFIPRVGYTWYRKFCGWYESWARVAVMCIPFSWCSCTLHIQNYAGYQTLKNRGNALLLATHCSRIDWLIGAYLSMLYEGGEDKFARVNFVAEATIALMPVIGWTRVLFGDILVTRAFHKDGPRIAKNIESFIASGVERLIFLAPEGFIADPGSTIGAKYIADCETFMAGLEREKLTHLLTPRYKGMQAFVKHAPSNLGSCAMSFVSGYPTVDERTGVRVGGVLATRSLHSPMRSIPDLHSIFSSGLSVFITYHPLGAAGSPTAHITSGEPTEIRDALIHDQMEKDAALRHFETHGKYAGIDSAQGYASITPPHLYMNSVMFGQSALFTLLVAYLSGWSVSSVLTAFAIIIVSVASIHGTTHYMARVITGCDSRESLVGETAIKASIDFLIALLSSKKNGNGKPMKKTRSQVELEVIKGD